MTIEKEFTLKPLISGYSKHIVPAGKPYYEQIVMHDGDYPFAMVHQDLFWPGQRGRNPKELYAIHDALNEGRTIKVRVRFDIIEE